MYKLDFKSPIPIYEQIIAQTKEYLVTGSLKPGDSLKSVRELAKLLGINPNTVAKAYKELERQHIIVTLQGRGTFVEESLSMQTTRDFTGELKPLVAEMLLSGMDEEMVLTQVRAVVQELKK